MASVKSALSTQTTLCLPNKETLKNHGGNSVNCHFFLKKNLTFRFKNKFAAKCLLKIPPYLIFVATLHCNALTSGNKRQPQINTVINYTLPGIVVTYLKCSGITNNKITTGLLLSHEKSCIVKSVNIWHIYGKSGFCRTPSSTFSNVMTRGPIFKTS